MSLPPDKQENISSVFAARRQIRPIKVVNPAFQNPASAGQIFELIKIGRHYQLLPATTDGASLLPNLEGAFAFVILASAPGHVYCGPLAASDPFTMTDPRFMISGHTALTQREDVLFAGELFFKNGTLKNWTNDSGHYLPAASLRFNNLIPYAKTVLPEHLFLDVAQMNEAQANARLQARGYMEMH